MSEDVVISLGTDAIKTALYLGAPAMLAALLIGVIVSFFQAITQINEQTLTFIPKLLGLVVVLAIFGPWMIDMMSSYTTDLITSMPSIIRK